MKTLHVNASPRGRASTSLAIAQAFLTEFAKALNIEVDRFDLFADALPEFGETAAAAKMVLFSGGEMTTQQQSVWNAVRAVFDRLADADFLVINSPLWNNGTPYVLKQFFDVVTQSGWAFGFDPESGYSGLLTGRRAVIIQASGVYHENVPSGFGSDFNTPYICDWLDFVGIDLAGRIDFSPTVLNADLEGARKAAENRGLLLGQENRPEPARTNGGVMRLGITGTYSSGKTYTSLVASHFLGMPRTQARTMREILPEAAPGKDLDRVTSSQLIQMIVARHIERVVDETRLAGSGFVSDGCSLQEWIYGSLRVSYGVNPNETVHLSFGKSVEKTPELEHFENVMIELGKLFKRHVRSSFDRFVHLRNELPLARDGHRPVNERFRSSADALLLQTLEELQVPYDVIGGSVEERCEGISRLLSRAPVMPIGDAIGMTEKSYSGMIQ